jgi:hypothetical protein
MKSASSQNQNPAGKPTLEELLRLKRAERPDGAFWAQFERDLRQRQLVEIIEPRPWWHSIALLAQRRGVGAGMGAGALAALALGWGGLGSQLAQRNPGELALSPQVGDVSAQPLGAVDNAVRDEQALAEVAGRFSADGNAERFERLATSYAADATSEAGVTEVQSSGLPGRAETDALGAFGPAPFAELVAKGGASTAPKLADGQGRFLASASAAQPRLAEASFAPEGSFAAQPAQSFSSGEVEAWPGARDVAARPANRQERLLATIALREEPAADAATRPLGHVRERVAHRLADDEALYASVTRLGLSADRLSVRF